jgi:hypothetical protein
MPHKWSKYFILNLSMNDRQTSMHAGWWSYRYRIPITRFFVLAGSAGRSGHGTSSPLSEVDLTSKLIIIGHGHPWAIEGMDHWQLAHKLFEFGLRRVGLISFKSCYLGVDSFLDDFAAALNARGVRFGWLIGYRGPVWMMDGPTARDHHEVVGPEDFGLHKVGLKNSDHERIRLVRGNTEVIIPGSRRFGLASGDLSEARVLRTITS